MPDARASAIAPSALTIDADAESLHAALAQAARFAATRTAIPAVRGVLFTALPDGLTLTATDMETFAHVSCDAAAGGFGSFVLADPKAAGAVLKSVRGPLGISHDPDAEQVVVVTFTGATYRFPTLPRKDYPNLPPWAGGASGTLDRAGFASILERTLPAVSRDDSRPVLAGLRLRLAG